MAYKKVIKGGFNILIFRLIMFFLVATLCFSSPPEISHLLWLVTVNNNRAALLNYFLHAKLPARYEIKEMCDGAT